MAKAIPKRAMNPTDAGTERFCPVIHKAVIPPTKASGTFRKMRKEFFSELKVEKRSKNVIRRVTGITIDSLSLASCCSWNWPPQFTR